MIWNDFDVAEILDEIQPAQVKHLQEILAGPPSAEGHDMQSDGKAKLP